MANRKVRRRGHLRKRGNSWVVTYRAGGRQVWKSFAREEDAKIELARVQVDAARGELRAPTRVTFKVAADAWYRHGRTVGRPRKGAWKPSTARDYRSVLDYWLVPAFGTKRLEDVTPRAIEQWRRAKMQELHPRTRKPLMSARTAEKLVSVLHSIFEFAGREYGVSTNPAKSVDRVGMQYNGRFDFYTPEEVWALVRAATVVGDDEEEPDADTQAAREQDATIYLVAAFSGLRRGECLALRWRDVDFERQAIRVEHSLSGAETELGTTKSGKVRSVPMAPDVAHALARLSQRDRFVERHDFVFVGDHGAPLDGSALRRRYVRTLKRAGLRQLRFHDLRHSFGTIAANAALSGRELQAWMGHADFRTTERYTHYRERGDEAARLAEAFAPRPDLQAELQARPLHEPSTGFHEAEVARA